MKYCICVRYFASLLSLYLIYKEKKNGKKNNKENTLKGKVTDFL